MQLSLPFDDDPILPRIRACLLGVHGPQRDPIRHDPTSQFFRAVISSITRDEDSAVAFRNLQGHLGSWEELARAQPALIASLISPVTHYEDKAEFIVASAEIIQKHRGRVDLRFLADWPVDDAFAWLDRLPGSGPKVSAATLNFSSLRKRALVVDRHILRVSKRVGILPESAEFRRGFHVLMRLVPDGWDADDLYELHWLMKLHSQTKCRHQEPLCENCPLAELCAYARR